MITWTDTHAHLYAEEFDPDRDAMIAQAKEAGVGRVILPNVDHRSIDRMFELEMRHREWCTASMGLHPCSVKKDFERELYQVESWLSKRKFAAIGEMGTDLYWDKTFWPQQQEAFRIQARWAIHYRLPMIIHCRESIDETIALLREVHQPGLTGVFHCFTGTTRQANAITGLGFYLGIGGVSTFKNGGLDAVIPELELNSIVLETDSPYLAPVPHRGKRNQPAYLPLVAARVAHLRNLSLDELSIVTEANAKSLFNNQPVKNVTVGHTD